MTHEIRLLTPRDLDDLARFLTVGFRLPADSLLVSRAVLSWKYLEPLTESADVVRSYLCRDDVGNVIGHVGASPTVFAHRSISSGSIPTLHMMDWLGSPEHRSIGVSLMRKVHEGAATQFVVGGTEACRAVIKRTGYVLQEPLPVYQRVLHPGYWLRVPKVKLAERTMRLGRDLVYISTRQPSRAQIGLEVMRVDKFSPTIDPLVERAQVSAIMTGRDVARLNHLLRFPGQSFSAWELFVPPHQLCGFAILNLVPRYGGQMLLGKIVDCVLPSVDVSLWHAAILALTAELRRQGADVVQTFSSTSWIKDALQRSGFTTRFSLEFTIRDRQHLLPVGIPFYLMPIEADYAYT